VPGIAFKLSRWVTSPCSAGALYITVDDDDSLGIDRSTILPLLQRFGATAEQPMTLYFVVPDWRRRREWENKYTMPHPFKGDVPDGWPTDVDMPDSDTGSANDITGGVSLRDTGTASDTASANEDSSDPDGDSVQESSDDSDGDCKHGSGTDSGRDGDHAVPAVPLALAVNGDATVGKCIRQITLFVPEPEAVPRLYSIEQPSASG
jgi:hypothetical protein